MNLKTIAKELVTRAREGDQNAMALIRRTADSAKAGSKKADNALKMIMSYMREHPIIGQESFRSIVHERTVPQFPEQSTTIRGEAAEAVCELCDSVSMTNSESRTWYLSPENLSRILALPSGGHAGLMAGAVVLASGPDLTDDRIEDLGSLIIDEKDRINFFHGVRCGSKDTGSHLGNVLPPEGKRVFNVGRAVGTARGIQIVRKGGDLSHHNEVMAWELQ